MHSIQQIFSGVLAWGSSDHLWLMLDRFGIFFGDALIVAAFAGFVRRERVKAWIRRNHFPRIGHEGTFAPGRVRGLLIPVSQTDVPEWLLRELRPQAVALAYTRQSQEAADKIERLARDLGITCSGVARIEDPDDPREAHAAASDLIARLLQCVQRDECAADTTGGKVPMSLGVFMAAEEAGIASLYVSSEYDPRLRRALPHTAHIVQVSSPY